MLLVLQVCMLLVISRNADAFHQLSGEEWFKDRKPAILALNPLANLPYLVDGDTCVCQTFLGPDWHKLI